MTDAFIIAITVRRISVLQRVRELNKGTIRVCLICFMFVTLSAFFCCLHLRFYAYFLQYLCEFLLVVVVFSLYTNDIFL
jgi:hypothetical protein